MQLNSYHRELKERYSLSDDTFERLFAYEQLLQKWQKTINLVSPSTLKNVWDRHFEDSLQLLPYIPGNASNCMDWGSGAGFPGLVIAIARPDIYVTLVESDQRKAAFLKTVSRETSTGVTVLNTRIEEIEVKKTDLITARALASLPKLFDYALSWAETNEKMTMLFLKGRSVKSEIAEAEGAYTFQAEKIKSVLSKESTILKITDLERKK